MTWKHVEPIEGRRELTPAESESVLDAALAELEQVKAERDTARAQLRAVAPIVRAAVAYQSAAFKQDERGAAAAELAMFDALTDVDPKMLEGLDDE